MAIAAMHLIGEANHWYQGFEQEYPSYSLEEFKSVIIQRFGPSAFTDAPIALKELRQTSSVSTYQSAFEDLKARLSSCPESFLVGCYIGGLQDQIKLQVQVWKPAKL